MDLLKNWQLAASLRIWFLFRYEVQENPGYGDYHLQSSMVESCILKARKQEVCSYILFLNQKRFEHDTLYEC